MSECLLTVLVRCPPTSRGEAKPAVGAKPWLKLVESRGSLKDYVKDSVKDSVKMSVNASVKDFEGFEGLCEGF